MQLAPPISVTKLMVEKPLCNPIRIAILWWSKTPITGRIFISAKGDTVYCLILPPLLEIIPVVRWLPHTIIFQVRFL